MYFLAVKFVVYLGGKSRISDSAAKPPYTKREPKTENGDGLNKIQNEANTAIELTNSPVALHFTKRHYSDLTVVEH